MAEAPEHFLFYFNLLIFTLVNMSPHLNSTTTHLAAEMSTPAQIAGMSPIRLVSAVWWLVLLVGGCQTPRSKNIPLSVCFCCLLAGSPSKQQKHAVTGTFLLFVGPGCLPHSRTYPFGMFCCFFRCQSTHTAETYPCQYISVICQPRLSPKQQSIPLLVCSAVLFHCQFTQTVNEPLLAHFVANQLQVQQKHTRVGTFLLFAGFNCLCANSSPNMVCFLWIKYNIFYNTN